MALKLFVATRHFAITMIAASTLVACGGGGDSNYVTAPSTASTTAFPFATAIANFVNERKSSQFSISGTAFAFGQSVSFTGVGTASESTVASTFEGFPSLKKSITTTGTLDMLGNQFPIGETSATFFDTNYSPLGNTGANVYCVVTSKTPIPITASIGDNGDWFMSTCYTDSSKLNRIGTSKVSYALEPEANTTALLKLVTQLTDTSGNRSPTNLTLRITTSGAVTRVDETGILNAAGVTLNYVGTYY